MIITREEKTIRPNLIRDHKEYWQPIQSQPDTSIEEAAKEIYNEFMNKQIEGKKYMWQLVIEGIKSDFAKNYWKGKE